MSSSLTHPQEQKNPPQKRHMPTQEFPKNTLKDALRIAESIKTNNAGRPFNRLTLAKSLNYTPNSSTFRMLITSSGKFGLTKGSYQAEKIELTELGISIVIHKSEEEKNASIKKALLGIPFYNKFFSDFNNNMLPNKEILINTLIRDYNIPPEDTEVCYKMIVKNAEELGIIENDVKGSRYIMLSKLSSTESVVEAQPENASQEENTEPSKETEDPPVAHIDTESPSESLSKKNIFIAHGHNKKPLDQLTKMLDKFKIPYIVAIDEPNRALPVSEKIAEIMKQCSAGIFIFTADAKFTNEEGAEIYRPSENVIYELGAASVLYGNKIVIFKEEGISFPSDFSGIGYTSFEKDNLSAKAPELLAELVQFNLVKLIV